MNFNNIKRTPKNVQGAKSIAQQIRKMITSQQLVNGDQLPSERELSETYSSSRSTVRKALNNLEEDGYVLRKIGSGTFVTYDETEEVTLETVITQISPIQLIEARIGFERQMLRLAIAHAAARDIGDMDKILSRMQECEQDKLEFTRLDSEFHLSLARASGNPLILQLYGQINQVRNHSQWQVAREIILNPDKIREYNTHHKQILDALKKRDAKAGLAALNIHMELAHKDLLGTRENTLNY